MKYVGRDLVKLDSIEKVTGRAKYAGDLQMDGMLYAAPARSKIAHALVKSVDVSSALAYPGVSAVFTAADIPGQNLTSPTGKKDQPFINNDHIRFMGEAVAVVVGDSIETARRAAELVKAEYEELPVIAAPAQALERDAAKIHDGGNIMAEKRTIRGNYAKAAAEADLIISNTYTTQAVDHSFIEPDACVAYWDGDVLTVRTTTKSAHHDQDGVCTALDLPPERVRVKSCFVGGSFGGKSDIQLVCMTALCAFKLGRPVKMVSTREEVLIATTKRHPSIIKYTHAVRKDGKILGISVDITLEAGGYGGYSGSVLGRIVGHAVGPYDIDNVEVHGRAVYTNKPSSGAMRGYGTPQASFAYEAQMDIIAERLGMSPFEIREINAIMPGDKNGTGQVMSDDIRFRETLEDLRQYAAAFDRSSPYPWIKRGWGIASFFYGNGRTGLPNPGTARCEVNDDGNVVCFVGSPDIGQGSDTLFRQIAAEVLSIPAENVTAVSADTKYTEDSGTTSGTRLTFVCGNGVYAAAENLRVLLKQYQKEKKIEGELKYILPILAKKAKEDGISLTAKGRFDPDTVPLDEDGQGKPYGAYTFGTQYVEVSVNTLTGRAIVDRVVASYDSGTIVNPTLYAGQMDGGIGMGVGYALTENMGYRDGNRVGNNNFDTYLLPTSLDMPETEVRWVNASEKAGPFGAKGIGEPATIPTGAAIANAVKDASGIRYYALPMTLESILTAETARREANE